jgi:hypothetical protein
MKESLDKNLNDEEENFLVSKTKKMHEISNDTKHFINI